MNIRHASVEDLDKIAAVEADGNAILVKGC